ncbi:cyclic AMP-dependent protein kinasecatalytic subunit [Aphelenchoides avenae]|nr:cyclic AMP-dependent protein kinasecatalytic subunit [Aphelenchus avenae]
MSCDIQNSISSASGTVSASDSSDGSRSPSADAEFVWPDTQLRKEPCNSATSATEEEYESEYEDEEEDEEEETDEPELDDKLTELDSITMAQIPLRDKLSKVCTIGTGTFGRVYLTRNNVTGEYFALKAMYIPTIVAKRQTQHVYNEKRVLLMLNHPFIVKMYDSAKDSRFLYMVMEFLRGGELFSYLRMTKAFPSAMVKFYAAEIVLALEYLHSLRIAYRDLKPENLLICESGHIKLTDFGFAKEIHNRTYTVCGTPDYMAPEVIERKGHNCSVDYWALGILIYELMAGRSPFRGRSAADVLERIREQDGEVHFPRKTFSTNAKDIIRRLLKEDPKDRLGYNSTEEIKQHPWFEGYDWQQLLNREATPPLIPTVYEPGDTGNFDTYEEPPTPTIAPQRDLDLFAEW